MEEEIIVPEEEVFDYQTLRYILDKDGYVCHASIGGFIVCDSGQCTEYTGKTPSGYSTIEKWYEENYETLNAWKIVDGNLAFDPNRYETLRLKCEKEQEDNRYVCHKEISNLTNLVKSDNAYNYLTSETDTSKLLEVTDSNKFASTHIEITPNQHLTNKLHIKFNNGNLLTNDATPKNVSGIYFVVNPDRTIYMSGIATNDIEYDIGGYSNNTKPILAFKKGINYYLSSNGYQIKMYYFDGTDRNEIYSGNGGVINFTDDDRKVTQIVLFIPNGTNTNASISPMLNVGDIAKEYIAYEGNTSIVYLGEYSLEKDSYIEIDNGIALIRGGDPIYLDSVEMPTTYLDLTYMYCMEDLNIKVTYPNTQRNNDLTGYETPNGGFAIDEEGNMYCNNATITGGTIDLTSPDNLPVLKVTNSDGTNSAVSGAEIGIMSSDKMRFIALSNFEGRNPYLILDNEFEDGGGQTILSSTGLTRNGKEMGFVEVSSTQPTNGEKVWFQKSNNLYNGGDISGTRYIVGTFNQLPAGTYTLSALATSRDTDSSTCLIYDMVNERTLGQLARNTRSSITFTLTSPTNQIAFCAGNSIANSNGDTFSFTDIQIERGTSASNFEPYAEDKIYTKNADGVYEEFLNVEKLNKMIQEYTG